MTEISTLLLQRYIEVSPDQRLLTLGVAPELVIEWAERVSTDQVWGQVWAIADDLTQLQATQQLTREAHLNALRLLHTADLLQLAAFLAFDACAVDILSYPNRAYLHRLLSDAAQLLKPGGAFYIAGGNDEGIHSLEKRLRAAWGNVSVLAYKKGHRLLMVPKLAELPPLERDPAEEFSLEIRQQRFRLIARPGVFAGGHLDDATRLLAESITVQPNDRVLDLGCGSGILGMLAARLAPAGEVALVDSSAVALATAQENCRLNALSSISMLASDGVSAVRDRRFDLVLCNPPFHTQRTQGSAMALRFIKEAWTVLAPRGRFYLVINQFLRYESAMSATFGNVTTIANDGRYKVLRSEQSGPA